MIGIDVPIDKKACECCAKCGNPCAVNQVTASRAVLILRQNNQLIPNKLITIVYEASHKEKPGTELKKLISWFVWSKKASNCKRCLDREQRMNEWGPDKCEKNVKTIIAWLRESAVERGYPFSERIAGALVRRAIQNSRTKSSS